MKDKQTAIIAVPPNLLNIKCANWVDVVVVDGACYDKDAVAKLLAEHDALAAQNSVLLSAISAVMNSGKSSGFGVQSPESIRAERLAWMQLNEVTNATPQQCLREVQAEAGRAGWLACLDKAEDYFDSYYAGMLTDADADKYADTIRQGGA